MKALDNCRWVPRWVSHMGSLKGCIDYLGLDISDAWLYGGTGHAFVINIHDGVCPSGPTAWHTERLFELGPNLGYALDGVVGFKQQDDFRALQGRAFAMVRQAIDEGHPCYGWELDIPEFYVVYGYDDPGPDYGGGYYYSGPGAMEGTGPKDWQDLGDTGIGVLEMYSVAPGKPAEDAVVVKEALAFALQHAENPEKWISDDYHAGIEGYEAWIAALEAGKASDMGMRYNTGVWLECRRYGAEFLKEAKTRLPERLGPLFDEAHAHYAAVAESLGKVAEIYPWDDSASDEEILPVDDAGAAAVKALQAAKDAESAGLRSLEKIVQAL